MKVTILQTDIIWASPETNIRQAEELIGQAGAADLYVLPEMWATGFAVHPDGIAEDEDTSAALQWMKQKAADSGSAISGSLAVRTADSTYRNRHYFVTPDVVTYYDKHHLFSHGHENEYYTAGHEAVIVEWQGWRLLLLTCYDLRFPVFSRYGRAGQYDAIICVANWPQPRQLAWETLTRARAIENQCYMIAANRVGDDPACHYGGGSVIIDPIGRTLNERADDNGFLSATLSIEKLLQMRQRFRVLDDSDLFVQ